MWPMWCGTCWSLIPCCFPAVFSSLDMSRSVSVTATGQCRLAPLIQVILDCSHLYDYTVKLLFKLHSCECPQQQCLEQRGDTKGDTGGHHPAQAGLFAPSSPSQPFSEGEGNHQGREQGGASARGPSCPRSLRCWMPVSHGDSAHQELSQVWAGTGAKSTSPRTLNCGGSCLNTSLLPFPALGLSGVGA